MKYIINPEKYLVSPKWQIKWAIIGTLSTVLFSCIFLLIIYLKVVDLYELDFLGIQVNFVDNALAQLISEFGISIFFTLLSLCFLQFLMFTWYFNYSSKNINACISMIKELKANGKIFNIGNTRAALWYLGDADDIASGNSGSTQI